MKEPEKEELSIGRRCPVCGSGHFNVSIIFTTEKEGRKVNTYRCQNCRYTWDEEEDSGKVIVGEI